MIGPECVLMSICFYGVSVVLCDLDTRTLLSITKHLYSAIVKWTEAISSQPEQLTTEMSPRLSTWNQVKRFLDWQENQLSAVVNKCSTKLFIIINFWCRKIVSTKKVSRPHPQILVLKAVGINSIVNPGWKSDWMDRNWAGWLDQVCAPCDQWRLAYKLEYFVE